MFLTGHMERVTQLCASDPGLFPDQLMRCTVAWASRRTIFHMGWLSSDLYGWAASGSQAWLLIFCYDAACSADMLLHVSDSLSHLPRCFAFCGWSSFA